MRQTSIQLSGVPETLLIPLYMRARDAREAEPYLGDTIAADTVAKIDYDFTKWDDITLSYWGCVARAKRMDDEVRRFLAAEPDAVVISIGSGLDTRFQRVDNGRVRWYDLDFPEVIKLRRQLLPPETARQTCIAASALDPNWPQEVDAAGREVLLVSEGVVMYFTPAEMRSFLGIVGEHFRPCTLHLDLISALAYRLRKQHDAVAALGAQFHWGSRDGSEVLQWAEGLRQIGLADPTDEMRECIRPAWKRLAIPFIRLGNNRIGMYRWE